MTRNKLVITVITILTVYVIITGLFGEKGYFVNQRLKQMVPVLQDELELLITENRSLTDLKISFEADYQKILEEAYRYGYLQENEFRIIYNSFTSYDSRLESSAKLGKRIILPTGVLTQKQINLISLLSGVLINIILSIYHVLKKNKITHNSETSN
ncbi:MAG: hypothetical protein HQ557_01330 [Bacteroidetes bacterium]|nr:hypothetical protein [Bacteroidota bacterium]